MTSKNCSNISTTKAQIGKTYKISVSLVSENFFNFFVLYSNTSYISILCFAQFYSYFVCSDSIFILNQSIVSSSYKRLAFHYTLNNIMKYKCLLYSNISYVSLSLLEQIWYDLLVVSVVVLGGCIGRAL